MERKNQEKKRKQREEDRKAAKKAHLLLGVENPYNQKGIKKIAEEEFQDDILNFKDSDRDSLLSYIQSASALPEVQPLSIKSGKNVVVPLLNTQSPNLKLLKVGLIDTPTRLVNESNEFLEMQLKKKRKKAAALVNHNN